MNAISLQAAPDRHRAWLMVALAFLSQGAAYGMTFGMAGTFIVPAGQEFHSARVAASLGPSLVALLHGLLGPLVGRWLAAGSVRTVMTIGSCLMAAAYLLMHLATNIWMFSIAFGVLGGAAVACLGVVPVTTLVGRWFPRGGGRALGVANMPILITVLPVVGGFVTLHYGWRTTVLAVGLASLALVPLFGLVREPPSELGFTDPEAPAAHGVRTHCRSGAVQKFHPDAPFWMLAAAVGIFDGSGITIITHVIPYATEAGVDYQRATLLVSIMGLCGLAGAPILGLLADRLGGPGTLALVAILLFGGWAAFVFYPPYPVIAAATGLLGFCGGAFAALMGATLARLYRGPKLGPAVGLAVLVALPFNFVLPLLAGYVHDRTGAYQVAFLYQLGLFTIALVMLVVVARLRPWHGTQARHEI